MPRTNRILPGGMLFHVLNRGVGRQQLFRKAADYLAFEQLLEETVEKSPMRICSYCLMPNHWHFVLWPEHDGDLATFMQRLTVTHVTRWQKHRKCVGEGHVDQGRFKSFPVESDDCLYQVARYVERNALRANLVDHARPCGELAMVKPLATGTRDIGPEAVAWPVATTAPRTMAGICQRNSNRG